MSTKRHLRAPLVGAVLAAVALSGQALAQSVVNEVESGNNSITTAQSLTIGTDGQVVVNGVIAKLATSPLDIDFYTFGGHAGNIVTIDIDNTKQSSCTATAPCLDSYLALFDSSGKKLRENNDLPAGELLDAGSVSTLDARITNFVLPATGWYTVAVTRGGKTLWGGMQLQLLDGGTANSTFVNASRGYGSYTLTITGVLPPVQQINIAIKPGSGDYAPINPKSKGSIPVALLGSAEFDAVTADPQTVTFGPVGSEAKAARCDKSGTDVNGDGKLDVVCHFDNQTAGFTAENLEGTVRGQTTAGRAFEGRGLIKIAAPK